MYADDTVLYVHGLTKNKVAVKLTNAMVKITAWLNQMFFVSGEKLEIVKEFKYLALFWTPTLISGHM